MNIISKKSKARTHHPSSKAKGSRDDDRAINLLDVTIAAINTTKDLVPIQLAKGILGTIANILTIAQSVIKNKSDLLAIVNKCDTIRRILERATKGATDDDLQGSLGDALSELNISVNRINSEVASKQEQTFWERLFYVTIDRDCIAAWEKDLDRFLTLFNIELDTISAIGIKNLTSEVKGNANAINVPRYRLTVPPPPLRPSMFYGRDDLVAELTKRVIYDEHIALIGAGGMGKSSLAKAILNEPLVKEKFAERRIFVTYDDLDPSTITFEAFMTRFAGALGIELAGADPLRQICIFLRSTGALIVFDNAETFEEASGSSALHRIPQAISDIADIPSITLILTSRSRKNAPNVLWITRDIPPLDTNFALEAFYRIYRQASRSNSEEEITHLLKELELHPLSINLLANAAQQSGWSPTMLLKRWKDQPSTILDHGKGKLQSLSATMQLSLSSPSILDLGDNGRRALAIIAFLPQGLNSDLTGNLLPSLSNRHCTFIKMLAPIRHYVQNSSLAALISTCLPDVRAFYYRTVLECSPEGDNIIISDHLNIEHMVTFDLIQIPNTIEEIYPICGLFLQCLEWHLPRPTILSKAIFNTADDSSTWFPKARCLECLGWLHKSLSQLTEATRAFRTAKALYLAAGAHEGVALCTNGHADIYICEGRFIQTQEFLEDFQHSDSWKYLGEATKAEVWFFLDCARVSTHTAPADELFSSSMEDSRWGLQSKIEHWRVKLYYGEDIVQVKIHLEDLLLQSNEDLYLRGIALLGIAEISFYQGRLSETMGIIQKIAEILEANYPQEFLCITVSRAVVASHLGKYDLARELIHKASDPFEFLALRSALVFLYRSYGSACVELAAGEYDKAESYFNATIEGCDMQGNLYSKAFTIRGLGEIAFVRGNFALATQHFAETQSLCTEMGVPPRKLYSCESFYTLPERFEGWELFLEGRSPFANAV